MTSDAPNPPPPKRPRRRRDPDATRQAILEAGRKLFSRSGYEEVSLRQIAQEAGADVALVQRYFGGKEGLFAEALKAAFHSGRLDTWERGRFPADIAAAMVAAPHADEAGTESFQFLLRAAVSGTTEPLARQALQDRFIDPLSRWVGGPRATARGRMMTALIIGLLVERLVRGRALSGEEADDFTEELKRLLTHMLEAPADESPDR